MLPAVKSSQNHQVAIIGGSFDPVHNGHLHIAGEILRLTSVDKVIFVPSGKHHFKQSQIHLDYAQRLDLLRLASKTNDRFDVWDVDSPSTSGYTSDMFKQLYRDYPEHRFCFVLGSDNVSQLPRWHDFAWLSQNVEFLIIPRFNATLLPEVLAAIRYQVLSCELSPISSTLIRENIAQHLPITGLVPRDLEPIIIDSYRSHNNT
ncbi:MAG: nicotinate (nicotinamide) nucleotide adenylyltransferase [Candidatus Cloacimonetes bacterium HGW-Cloacimonetes-1]|jgi:nicotinate-nucleotide adenylyltransferase|nr:MAG: nicotinate (nicotinamide) nucleotide adenylyltransferase [Candidatus Cloacimonetes bacterium HGW-Cloacimonetes-1]